MDLMTAVIVGADGTPYHDGLFFFDIFFPDCYPNVPPVGMQHFEDLVKGHFNKRANDIMVACKAYTAGAQVGCLVKGGIQDVDERRQAC
ncbi:Probable ubiquitin-conjugating enzyme E2 25 [Linum grandiflorum]